MFAGGYEPCIAHLIRFLCLLPPAAMQTRFLRTTGSISHLLPSRVFPMCLRKKHKQGLNATKSLLQSNGDAEFILQEYSTYPGEICQVLGD